MHIFRENNGVADEFANEAREGKTRTSLQNDVFNCLYILSDGSHAQGTAGGGAAIAVTNLPARACKDALSVQSLCISALESEMTGLMCGILLALVSRQRVLGQCHPRLGQLRDFCSSHLPFSTLVDRFKHDVAALLYS